MDFEAEACEIIIEYPSGKVKAEEVYDCLEIRAIANFGRRCHKQGKIEEEKVWQFFLGYLTKEDEATPIGVRDSIIKFLEETNKAGYEQGKSDMRERAANIAGNALIVVINDVEPTALEVRNHIAEAIRKLE